MSIGVRWEKKMSVRAAQRWLREKYRAKLGLFSHWDMVHHDIYIFVIEQDMRDSTVGHENEIIDLQ